MTILDGDDRKSSPPKILDQTVSIILSTSAFRALHCWHKVLKVCERASNSSKLIIISDPGVDDEAAILVAVAHPNDDALAVISNLGVVSSTEAADNARKVLNWKDQIKSNP